uniref:Transmembrane protein n=1 Tax=Schistosoma mansoni TaxID=6183 RepID=A0A3Q0KR43_SCHMA
MDSDAQYITSSANQSFRDASTSNKESVQYANESIFSSYLISQFVSEHIPSISGRTSTQDFNAYILEYINYSKQSKSVQEAYKLEERFLSSQTSSADLNIYSNPSTALPVDVLKNLHLPQYRPVPAHKLGIMSEDLSSAFPILNFTSKQQPENSVQQVPLLEPLSSSPLKVTSVILPTTINTSLENQSVGLANKCDNSLTQSYDKIPMRLILTDGNQNYSAYNSRIYDYNKHFHEHTNSLTDRNINNSEQSTGTKFHHPGGDSGISNTSPDTYSLSEPGIVVSTPQYPLDNIIDYNRQQQKQHKIDASSQTVQKNSSCYILKNDDNNQSKYKIDSYATLNQHLFSTKDNIGKNVYIPSISTNHNRIKLCYDKNIHKMWQKYENHLNKNSEVTSSSSLSTSPSSLTSSPSATLPSSPTSSSSSSTTNSLKNELFTIRMNRLFKDDSSDYDDSAGDQQDEVHRGKTQKKYSTVAIPRLVSKNKYHNKKDLTSDNDSVSYQSQRNKFVSKIIKIIYGILLTTMGFLLVCIQFNGKNSESIILEVFLNFLLTGQLLHFLSFYATTYFNACRPFYDCCLVNNKLQHSHYFPYRRSRVTDQFFTNRRNHVRTYRKRKNETVDNDNSQLDIKHQSKKLSSPKRQILISRPDGVQYCQLMTIDNAKDFKLQFRNINQKKRITTNLKNVKNVHTNSRIILQCEYIILGFFCVGSLISIMYYGDRIIKLSTSIWYSSNHTNSRGHNTNHFINENVDHHHVDEKKYLLGRKTPTFADNNISNLLPIITNSSTIPTSNSYIFNRNNSYGTIFNCTVSHNKTNITIDNSYTNHDFHQITYINWLKLINNVLWVLLLVIQIPMIIKLKKIFPKILRIYNGLPFVHVIAANLTGWFRMAYVGTENYLSYYHESKLNKTYEIKGNFNRLLVLKVIQSPLAYLLNCVACSHLLVVVLIWISWDVRKLIKNLQNSENIPRKNRLVHWAKESNSPSPNHHKNSTISRMSRSASNYNNKFYCRCERKSSICGLISFFSVIIYSIHLFAYRLNEFSRILLCYFSYFLILVSTITQNFLLVYCSTYGKHSNRDYTYSRKFSNDLIWLKPNLLYFPLLFQLTGSICFNLMQVIEILLKFTNVYAKDFDANFSFLNTSITRDSLSTHAIHQRYMNNQYRYVSHQELFLKYVILFTLCIEVIENCIEIICIPLIMVKYFLHRIAKPTFFTNLVINLLTNEIFLLLMKFFNPQLLSLGDDSILNCSINYSNSHNMTNKGTTGSINRLHDDTYKILVPDTNIVVNSQTNFMNENKTIDEICNLVQFSIVGTNWWYWIFIKQLSYSICIIFRQSMLICCGFLYLS